MEINTEQLNIIKPYLNEVKAYLVGGNIRDSLLKKESFDMDIILDCEDVKPFVENIANKIGAHFVSLHEDFEIFRIVMPDKKTYFDFAKIEGKDINEDLSRRDFSINAICYDINNEEIIDLFGGMNDIKSKKIKLISEKNLVDDPLRIMRAFRFASVLEFSIDDDTLMLIKKHSSLLEKPAKERLIYELMKMFSGQNVSEILNVMDECGLVDLIFPYFKEIKKVPENSHHHLDLFHHLLESVKQIELEYEKQTDDIKNYLTQDFGSSTKFAYLKLATFLHDYGKPSTWTIDPETNRHRFIGHDNVGAELIKADLKELKFSKKQIEYISKMIKYHIYPSQLVSNEEITDKAKLRFYNKLKDDVIDVILVAHADRNSALGPDITKEMVENNRLKLDELLNGYFEERSRLNLPLLLNGNEIMEILNIPQSKQLGDIVKALKTAQIEKIVSTKEDAISFVKNMQ